MFCRLAVDCIRSSTLPGEQLMVYCSRKRQIRMHICTAHVARSLVYFKACEQIVIPLYKKWKFICQYFLYVLLLGWFSNRTGTLVEDDARKSNNWLDQRQSGKLGTGSLVQSFPRAFPLSTNVPVLSLNQSTSYFIRRTTTILNSLSLWSIRALITDTWFLSEMALIFEKFLRLFRIHPVNAVVIGSKQRHVNRKRNFRTLWQWFCPKF